MLAYISTFNLAGIGFACFCLLYPLWVAFDERRNTPRTALESSGDDHGAPASNELGKG